MDEKQKMIEQSIQKNGFVLEQVRELSEIKAVLYQMHYEKNGAKLMWLRRREENKTFAIAFKTLPSDDTGVFHILEHSLLCGSEKYPMSKPFVEMIKSSLQTFMNAFTFPDKTMFPVCSRNHQDFLNLMDVYLDAVFHPLCVTKKDIFLQEGWHYEMDHPEDEVICNGVVYNEMKGVYASPDTRIDSLLNRLLFPDNCYRFQSGGDPEHITELTYENYVANYKRFYHPSNAYIILDGEMEIDSVLAKIDSVLNEYGRLEIDSAIRLQKPVHPKECICPYEVGENEETEHKVILAGGWVYGQFDEPEKNIACSVLAEALCSSDKSPVKKAILEKGLAENVELDKIDGIQQSYLRLVIRNTSEEKKEEVWNTIHTTLKELAEKGLDHKRLESILSRMEFQMREKESGSFPTGIMNSIQMLESCLYGGDPAQNLCYSQMFRSIRNKIEKGYFERLICEVLLENPHYAQISLQPSRTLGEEKRIRERERLKGIKEQWSEEEKEQVIHEYIHLRKIQETPDTPEQLASIPVLSLSDIPEEVEETPQTVTEIEGSRVLLQRLETEGITHITYYFSLEDQTLEELSMISFLRTLLGQTETEHYSALELQAELEGQLGRFQSNVEVFAERGQTEMCHPYLVLHVSVLDEKIEEAVRLTGEVLNTSVFRDVQYIRNRIRQLRMSLEQHVLMSGNRYAMQHVAAGFSARGAVWETLQGIQMLRWVQKMDAHFEQEGERLLRKLEQLCRRIFVRERTILSVTGNIDDTWLRQLLQLLPDGAEQIGEAVRYPVAAAEKMGIRIPAEIGFAGKGANLKICGAQYHGAMQVAAKILTYGYLWNTIRVQGGAYGTGLTVSENGDVTFSSFRDPNVVHSLTGFHGAGAALRSLCEDREPLDRYIVSTIASIEPLLSVRQKGIQAAEDYLNGVTIKMRQKERYEILHTTKEELIWISHILDNICQNAGVCVIGGKTTMDAAESILTQIVDL